jgi:hypothetical protein
MTSKAKRHAKVEKLSIAGIEWNFSPTALIVYAEHFLAAAKSAEPLSFNPARSFLVCRSIELALKAFLSLRGTSLNELARGVFAHNLKELCAEAEKKNLSEFIKLGESELSAISFASDYYVEKVLEYPALLEAVRAYPKMPNTKSLIEISDVLIGALKNPCLESS